MKTSHVVFQNTIIFIEYAGEHISPNGIFVYKFNCENDAKKFVRDFLE